MGRDVYLEWNGITKEEKEKQYTGYDVTAGKVGYLRGAYNGHVGLDAIEQFFGKYYNSSDGKAISFDFEYIEKNLKKMENGLFKKRKKDFYHDKKGNPVEIQSYRDFLALAKKKKEEGKTVTVAIR